VTERFGNVLTHPVADFKREAYVNCEAKSSDLSSFRTAVKNKAKSFYVSIITNFLTLDLLFSLFLSVRALHFFTAL